MSSLCPIVETAGLGTIWAVGGAAAGARTRPAIDSAGSVRSLIVDINQHRRHDRHLLVAGRHIHNRTTMAAEPLSDGVDRRPATASGEPLWRGQSAAAERSIV